MRWFRPPLLCDVGDVCDVNNAIECGRQTTGRISGREIKKMPTQRSKEEEKKEEEEEDG